jgi:hypothetical protein
VIFAMPPCQPVAQPYLLGMHIFLWSGCAAALAVAGVATIAEQRRVNRRNLDNVGFMPWPLITVLAMMIALSCAAIAIKAP